MLLVIQEDLVDVEVVVIVYACYMRCLYYGNRLLLTALNHRRREISLNWCVIIHRQGVFAQHQSWILVSHACHGRVQGGLNWLIRNWILNWTILILQIEVHRSILRVAALTLRVTNIGIRSFLTLCLGLNITDIMHISLLRRSSYVLSSSWWGLWSSLAFSVNVFGHLNGRNRSCPSHLSHLPWILYP